MKRFFLIVYLLATVSVVFAQTQQGYVKTRGRMNANGTVVSGTRLTGATITSNAVTTAVNEALENFKTITENGGAN